MNTIIGKCVMVDTPEASRMIQELAFKAGITWNGELDDRFYDVWTRTDVPSIRYITFNKEEGLIVLNGSYNYDIVSLDEAVKLLKNSNKEPKPI